MCTCHVMTNETTCQSKNCNAKIPDMKTSTQEAKNWHIQTSHNKTTKNGCHFCKGICFVSNVKKMVVRVCSMSMEFSLARKS